MEHKQKREDSGLGPGMLEWLEEEPRKKHEKEWLGRKEKNQESRS